MWLCGFFFFRLSRVRQGWGQRTRARKYRYYAYETDRRVSYPHYILDSFKDEDVDLSSTSPANTLFVRAMRWEGMRGKKKKKN